MQPGGGLSSSACIFPLCHDFLIVTENKKWPFLWKLKNSKLSWGCEVKNVYSSLLQWEKA